MRSENDLRNKLEELLALPAETEWVEFKQAKRSFSFNEIGEYFSALSNEANLKNQSCSWLVFGIKDKPHLIVGTSYRSNKSDLDSLKHEISKQTTGGITFADIHELQTDQGRVIMFEIPPAPSGIPVTWKRHFYGRDGESLVGLSLPEIEQIRNQVGQEDWTAVICEDATISDLDESAINQAQQQFAAKQNTKSNEVMSWSHAQFLNRAKITVDGRITRAALLLLGCSESAQHILSPAPAQLTWRLEGEERDYRHFGPPFLHSVDELYSHIRNTKFKIQPLNRLVPIEIHKYDSWVVMEALHNCIAHQDYTRQSRIVVTETVDKLMLENAGGFYEGSPEDYILHDRTPMCYRNPFLTRAMVNLNMIDTMGYGIKRMFMEQRKRFFPLPDFDLSAPDRVKIEIMGRVIDVNYTQLLVEKQDLEFKFVVALDKVQKHKPISTETLKLLRKLKLVEGRKPVIHVAAHIAEATGQEVEYTRQKAFDNSYYRDFLLHFIKQHGKADRQQVNSLFKGKLSDQLTENQRNNKVRNLLSSLRKEGLILNSSSRRYPIWILNK